MTLEVLPSVPHYIPAPPTNEKLPWADLGVVDLSKAATAEGRAELAATARDALHNIGFFYVINHGLSQEKRDRIFDIADIPFSQVSDPEKREYEGKIIETGSYQGYKPRRFWHINGGVQDEVEAYSINRDVSKKQHPDALRPYLPEIDEFSRHNHSVLHTILTLLAIGLELPEDAFMKQHGSNVIGESDVRFMKYYPRTAVEEEKAQQVWLKGHTDIGSITILWSQPVSALQILSPDGQWRWIRHIDNALVVNAGDCMEFLSGGFYKATIHRVFQPPVDQRDCTRLGAFYFAFPDENVKLLAASESPVLERVGIQRRFEDENAPTVETYRKARTATYGKTALKQNEGDNTEEEVVSGVLVKHYN
ncbi:Clavaminate synthase-like protein [Irpex rosettiformis]|uniref:Clavaminate synthase-like protein n=1 Tax=Irpex rosettiformis TaxID=378272 RepID=A0ACB8U5E4_9APHY|nr:Clavaminate synthase-like protein [Irpex rosettiformis]